MKDSNIVNVGTKIRIITEGFDSAGHLFKKDTIAVIQRIDVLEEGILYNVIDVNNKRSVKKQYLERSDFEIVE